jgi:hypothetical protein
MNWGEKKARLIRTAMMQSIPNSYAWKQSYKTPFERHFVQIEG